MGRNLLNPYLRGGINTMQYPVWTRIPRSIFSGKGVLGTASSFSSSSVLHQLVQLLTFNMPPSFFFFSSYVTAQKRLVKGNSCPDTSRSCYATGLRRTPAWSWVTGDLSGKGVSCSIGALKPEGWMAPGWQIGYPAAHLEVMGSHLT